jgi:hypothetical protein
MRTILLRSGVVIMSESLIYVAVVGGLIATVLLGLLPSAFAARLGRAERLGIVIVWLVAIVSGVYVTYESRQAARRAERIAEATRDYNYWREQASRLRDVVMGQWRTAQSTVCTIAPPTAETPDEKLEPMAMNLGLLLGEFANMYLSHSGMLNDAHREPAADGSLVRTLMSQRQQELVAPEVKGNMAILKQKIGQIVVDMPLICHRCEVAILDPFDAYLAYEREQFEQDPIRWKPTLSEDRIRTHTDR